MSEPVAVQGILIAHGAFAEGVLDAVRRITGIDDALTAVSNRDLGPDALAQAIRERLGDGPAILFTDLKSGSCGMTAHRLLRDRADLRVISGINLTMLLEFALHRTQPLDTLVPRLLDKGRAAIGCSPDPAAHGHRPAAG
jgi:mannose/fructose-specific phosphotransferase system component IIA